MTPDDAEKIQPKAGRELDALVAEKVMGWVDCKSSGGAETGNPPSDFPGSSERPNYRLVVPNYSTNVAAAWKVVEKVRILGGKWADETCHYGAVFTLQNEAERWQAGMAYPSGDYNPGWCMEREADTPELAICRVALALAEYRAE